MIFEGVKAACALTSVSCTWAEIFLSYSVAVRLDGMRDMGASSQHSAHKDNFFYFIPPVHCPDWSASRGYKVHFFHCTDGETEAHGEDVSLLPKVIYFPDSLPSALSAGLGC